MPTAPHWQLFSFSVNAVQLTITAGSPKSLNSIVVREHCCETVGAPACPVPGRIESNALLHIQVCPHCSVLVQLAFISSLLRTELFYFVCACVV